MFRPDYDRRYRPCNDSTPDSREDTPPGPLDYVRRPAVFGVMLALIGLGIVLFLAAPLIGRVIVGRNGDPVGITRVVQVLAVILMLGALLIRPHSDETAAFPPPPDMMDSAR